MPCGAIYPSIPVTNRSFNKFERKIFGFYEVGAMVRSSTLFSDSEIIDP